MKTICKRTVCLILTLLLIVTICSCSGKQTENADDTNVDITSDDLSPDSNTEENNIDPDPEMTEEDPAVGGDGFIIENYSYYPSSIMGIDMGNTEVKGCFIYDRINEVCDVIDDLDNLRKTYPEGYERSLFLYGNTLWHLVQRLDLTREDIEIYNDLSKSGLSAEQIDALLIEDEIKARKALRSENVLFSELTGELYTVYEVSLMDKETFTSLGIAADEVERVCKILDVYIPENEVAYDGRFQEYAKNIRDMAVLSEEENSLDVVEQENVAE